MAVDTAAKRFSIMNLGSPWRGPMVDPSGTVDVGERLTFLFLYSGISPSVFVPTLSNLVMQNISADRANAQVDST